jgi:glyoxylase-like metal-dependent hydrolase (beta-lactamase superfamily II)
MTVPVRSPWFESWPTEGNVTRFTEPVVNEMLVSNAWHAQGSEAGLVVDTGNGVGALRPCVELVADGRPLIAVVTHGHFDHVGGFHEFEDRRCHPEDADETAEPFPMTLVRERYPAGTDEMFAYYGYPVPDVMVSAVPEEGFDLAAWTIRGAEPTASVGDGDVIELGDRSFQVLHVPGHTPGSVALWEERTGILFTGDTLYADDRMDHDDAEAGARSLRRLRALPVRTMHPGHGRSLGSDEFGELADATIDDLEARVGR